MLAVACFVMFSIAATKKADARECGGANRRLHAHAVCELRARDAALECRRVARIAGGVVGQFIGTGLAANLNFLGATLLMLAAWMAGARWLLESPG
jgi:hypothetical protein